MKKQKKKDK